MSAKRRSFSLPAVDHGQQDGGDDRHKKFSKWRETGQPEGKVGMQALPDELDLINTDYVKKMVWPGKRADEAIGVLRPQSSTGPLPLALQRLSNGGALEDTRSRREQAQGLTIHEGVQRPIFHGHQQERRSLKVCNPMIHVRSADDRRPGSRGRRPKPTVTVEDPRGRSSSRDKRRQGRSQSPNRWNGATSPTHSQITLSPAPSGGSTSPTNRSEPLQLSPKPQPGSPTSAGGNLTSSQSSPALKSAMRPTSRSNHPGARKTISFPNKEKEVLQLQPPPKGLPAAKLGNDPPPLARSSASDKVLMRLANRSLVAQPVTV